MEQEVARWLFSQLGYNAAADATLSSNCRGNLKGLWEFVIANAKTAESKRHIQHVLAKHRREQEAARRAPEQQKEAEARRKRLHQLRKRNAELQQALSALHARTESRVQETVDQACEHTMSEQMLARTQAQTRLLEAFVHRGQKLLPELQTGLSQLQFTLDTIRARSRNTVTSSRVQQSLQQQVAVLSSGVKDGLAQAMWETVQQQGIPGTLADFQQQPDQQQQPLGATHDQHGQLSSQHQQQQGVISSTAEHLQQLLKVCRIMQGYKVPTDVTTSALQLLQHPPSLLLDICNQLAQHNLAELTARIDVAEREMLAPLHWPGSTGSSSVTGQLHAGLLQHKPDKQQLVVYADTCSKYKLPWASGLSLPSAAALQEMGISPPPEVRIKLRLKDHIQLHVSTQQTLQRAQAAQRELEVQLASTPLLQAADGDAAGGMSWGSEVAQLFIQLSKVRAQLQLMRQYEQRFTNELLQLKDIKAVTEDKSEDVQQQLVQDHELNQLLHLAGADTWELYAILRAQQQRLQQLLTLQLMPCVTAVTEAAQGAVGQHQREAAVVGKMPLLALTAPAQIAGAHDAARAGGASSSETNPVLAKTILARLQSAGQQLLLTGRATTGGKLLGGAAVSGGSSNGGTQLADTASVAALKGAALLDPVTPFKCPAALLLDMADWCSEARQLQQQLAALSATSTEAAVYINTAVSEEERLRGKVDQLHQHERMEVLPRLQADLDKCQDVRAFAKDKLMRDLAHHRDMPAMHLLPHRTYQGKNCSQWLLELQQLHAQRRNLDSRT